MLVFVLPLEPQAAHACFFQDSVAQPGDAVLAGARAQRRGAHGLELGDGLSLIVDLEHDFLVRAAVKVELVAKLRSVCG